MNASFIWEFFGNLCFKRAASSITILLHYIMK
jgi:hypothetical protein